MDSAILTYIGSQPLGIGGIQLCKLAVIQYLLHHGIIRGQLIQHIRRRGIACLGLFSAGKLHIPKQDLAQLFW